MRIGIFAFNADPEAGGGHTLEADIIGALAALPEARRHDPFVYSLEAGGSSGGAEGPLPRFRIPVPPIGRLVNGGVDRIRSFLTGRPLPEVAGCPRWVLDGVRESRADVVLCLSPAFYPGGAAPFVTIVLDLQHRLQPLFPEVNAEGQWERREAAYERVLPRASRVIVGTEAGKREVLRFFRVADANVRVIPHPTPRFALEAGKATSSPAPGISPSAGRYLLYPAQFWSHKNHTTALRALRILVDRGVDIRLVFCGSDKGNRGWVEAEVSRLGLGDRVETKGFVSRNELISLYRDAFALVYPSYFGPENLPPLEAFAIGCPVIAAAVPGAEEQLGGAALLFEAANEEDLSSAVMRLDTETGLRASLLKAGKARAERSTPESFASHLMETVGEVYLVRRCWPPADWRAG